MLKKYAARLLLVIVALVLAGCEYFNVPLEPFIEMNMAKVTLDAVNAGDPMAGGGRFIEHTAPGDYPILVTLKNTQQFNINAVIKSASLNGSAASNVSIESWTKNKVLLKITGAASAESYSIALKITSKDGVETGERVFDITLPPVLFHSRLETTILNPAVSLSAAPLPANFPIAHWKTQKNAAHTGISKIVIEYKYFDAVAGTTRSKAYIYGWDDSKPPAEMLREGTGYRQGFLASDAGTHWDCAFLLPYGAAGDPVSTALTPSSLLGCSFKVTVYDKFGLSAEAKSPGFDEGYGTYEARLGGIAYKTTLAQAITDAPVGSEASPTVIELLNPVQVSSTYSISGKHIKLTSVNAAKPVALTRQSSLTNFLFVISGGSSLTLEYITLDGNAVNSSAALINVNSAAKLFLKNGSTLRNNKNPSGSGGGVYSDGNVMVSENAVISGNEAHNGGGIYLTGGTLTMNGGKISNNTSGHDGGGVNVSSTSTHFTMNGGEITGNFAVSGGPGVWVGGGARFTLNNGLINGNIGEQSVIAWHNNTIFEMNGGRISGTVNPDGTRISSGVHVNQNAVFTMTAGEISDNRMAKTGGGVRVEGGIFNMSGSAVIKGNAVSDKGGGVYLNGGTFTMNGAAKINGNQSVGGGGGGVACGPSSVVVMNGGTISGNSAGNGAAVWVAYDRTFTMTGGQIHNNTGGSCVFVDSGTFDMQGGSISGNAGSAFNINGWGGNIRTLKMSGTAYIAPNNPVLFNDQCMTLQVTGGTPAATITPSAYTVGTQILSGSGVAASYTRFAITPNGGINYKIDSTGNLQIQP